MLTGGGKKKLTERKRAAQNFSDVLDFHSIRTCVEINCTHTRTVCFGENLQRFDRLRGFVPGTNRITPQTHTTNRKSLARRVFFKKKPIVVPIGFDPSSTGRPTSARERAPNSAGGFVVIVTESRLFHRSGSNVGTRADTDEICGPTVQLVTCCRGRSSRPDRRKSCAPIRPTPPPGFATSHCDVTVRSVCKMWNKKKKKENDGTFFFFFFFSGCVIISLLYCYPHIRRVYTQEPFRKRF